MTLLMFLPLTVAAQEPGEMPQEPTPTEKKQKLTKDELQTMAHYQAVNKMEIELGKVAQKNAGSQAVKEYGAMMVKEHGNHDKQLTTVAKQTKQKIPAYKPPTEAEKQEMAMAKKHAAEIKKLSGADFDREYLRMMVEDHDRELAKIDANIAATQNTELADLLKETKPIFQKHADQARELQKSSAQASR
jgi:putative membrane protein